ncbi:MAG: 16S rRNA (uracil(1498)-N(3))-methyltransferase [Ruminococcus sp.]|jgi:16S rRNA (uracil1498-N3)-methyltransferase|nr:16S rRNA (uracil(1498)-N(3))-methyltransferase [Ruminococcus sp.]
MYRFFLQTPPAGDVITVSGADAKHIGLSLRMKTGEKIVFTREGKDYFCEIEEITPNDVTAHIISIEDVKSEPKLKLTIFQALPKSDKMETIIEKCTELGAFSFVPFISSRCVAIPKDFRAKVQRWQKIAESAAKQSGRGIVPEVSEILSFSDMINRIKVFDKVYFCNENGGERITLPENIKTCAVIVGAEGGFALSEAEAIVKAGARGFTLGARILRCETAPITAASIIMYLAGEI